MPLRLTKRGDTWHATGTVAGQRIRKSLGTGDKAQAETLRAQLEARLWKRHAFGEAAVRTFDEAALSYLEQGGEGRFLPPILLHFRGRALAMIAPGEVRAAAMALLPGAQAATRNRQVLTPTKAVINHGAALGWCQRIAVGSFPVPRSRKHKPVDRAWLDAFLAQADKDGLPHLAAIVLFMHQTAARRSEAVHLLGDHVDLAKRIAVLAKTKTDEWSVRHLTAELVLRIGALSPQPGLPVFRYTDPAAVNRAMARVCARAKIEARTTHSAGRHSYATNAMKLPGATVKGAMVAGGWASAGLFMGTYVHDDAGRQIADALDAQRGPVGTETAQAGKKKRYRFGKTPKS